MTSPGRHPPQGDAGPHASRCPPIDRALLDWLDKFIPEVHVRPGEDTADLTFRHGRRDVVMTLRAQFARQQEKDA
jgi:hypothetical protein